MTKQIQFNTPSIKPKSVVELGTKEGVLYFTMTYSDKLKDPRWQKKRLEILDRDNFSCISCKSTDKTLHVHHSYYEKNSAPWDYPSISLITLCENCHEHEEFLKNFDDSIFTNLLKLGFTRDFLSRLLVNISQMSDNIDDRSFIDGLIKHIESYEGFSK